LKSRANARLFFFDRKLPEYWLPPKRKPLLKPTNQLSSQSGDGASSWTRYWQSGFQDTCFFADQTFAVDQFWHDLFTKLDHSSRIVDLATGNGSVALKAAKFAREQNQDFEISGVDYASICPVKFSGVDADLLTSIQFISNTDIASLPFETSSTNCVTSQYGFEYAQMEEALAEATRILVAGGYAQFLIHAEGGAVHEASGARLRRAQFLLQKGQVVMLLNDLAKAVLAGSASRRHKVQQRIEGKVASLQRKFTEAPRDDLIWQVSRESLEILAATSQVPGRDIAARIAFIRAEVMAYVQRLHAMRRAALNATAMDRLCQQAKMLGCETAAYVPFLVDGGQVGWAFFARKA
jgi:ubiquinone/menaquinone biosynthesis C-methylase UbiE